MYSYVGNKDEQEIENENEKAKLSEINVIEYYNNSSNKSNCSNYCFKIFLVFLITICIFSLFFFISIKMVNIMYEDRTNLNKDDIKNQEDKELNKIQNIQNINISNEKKDEKNSLTNNILNNAIHITNAINITNTINNMTNNIINNVMNINDSTKENKTLEGQNISQEKQDNITNKDSNKKIGLAFVYSTLFSNGIARFITLTANKLMETGNYDICFITGNPYHKEYTYNSSIKRFIAHNNYSLIKNITKNENIDIFILQNVLSKSVVDFYRALGKKVIGMFHGVFMSSLSHGSVSGYRNWIKFDYFDSYVFIAADDYYFYKKLGFKNEIYIPNLLPFEPSETQDSNLTDNNIMMLGRQNDPIKGAKYAIKSMTYVIKEVPDAKLTLVSSDGRIQFLQNLTKELNLTNNVFIKFHTYNISDCFWKSSALLYTSLSEAFPMAMNEGKAHGLPIVAFDVPYSPPYQDGVIVVDQLDCEALARETILLLKDYNYRKKMGQWAKKSLNKFSNKEIIETWEKLFNALLSKDINNYRNLQNEVEQKYYNEESAKIHMKKHFEAMVRINKNLSCHYLENLTDINYISNITECIINDTDTSQNLTQNFTQNYSLYK